VNFFERQEAARKTSRRLVVLFGLAVLGIVFAVNACLAIAIGGFLLGPAVVASVITLGIIGVASLFRVSGLRNGGGAVARELGGTFVAEDTADPAYRRLRNVVEEIAIASSVPVPEVYVLEQEPGINAFAAGWSTSDAAVAVTRGALDRLNRDELQGVIAHEFSHILNGDMRLNIRLVGGLFGILALALVGRKLLEGGRFAPRGRNSNAGAIVILALVVMLIGYIGLFFGRLIKSGVSRQREYLADASAVQFTRQTAGIAGALKKIGGLPEGSRFIRAEGEEVSHMLFGDGVGFSSMFATHPPLLQRIQALEPDFKPEAFKQLAQRWSKAPPSGLEEDRMMGLAGGGVAVPEAVSEAEVVATGVVEHVGAPESTDYAVAGSIVQAIPEVLREAARQSSEAVALVYGLLLSPDPEVRERQRIAVDARHGMIKAARVMHWADRLSDLHPMLRLPLAELAFPVIRRRPRPALQAFGDTVHALVHADGQVSAFEYCLGQLIEVQVHEALDPVRSFRPGRRKLHDVRDSAARLLALLAQAGHADEPSARRAFHAALSRCLPNQHFDYAPPRQGLVALDEDWPLLDELQPKSRKLLVEAMVEAVSHDGRVSVAQAELLRTACAILHCPVPPLLDR